MIKQPASIFNDVIGPVMRGPSSSHVAAAARIGKLIRQMVNGCMKDVLVEFDPNGALATTYHGHGSDIGFVGGLLGYEPSDPELPRSLEEAASQGINVRFAITSYGATHTNMYKVTMTDDQGQQLGVTAISIGGGMIEIQLIQGLTVNIAGDFYETIFIFDKTTELDLGNYINLIKEKVDAAEAVDFSCDHQQGLIDIKSSAPLPAACTAGLAREMTGLASTMELSPVLPIKSRMNCQIPFTNAKEMLAIAKEQHLQMWEMALKYESMRGDISEQDVFDKMKFIVSLLKQSLQEGLKGTTYENRILGPQAHLMTEAAQAGKLVPGDVTNVVITYITALMEVKSSMGVIVAAPTAGSCGGLPGTLFGTAKVMDLAEDDIVKGMLAAGLIGVFIAENSGFAAEVGGCQVECGAGSGMAAAGVTQLAGGTAEQCIDAASMALQNILGMVCDPVGDRVEVPCLGKNVMAGTNAIACANMILAGFDKVVPLDETLVAMDEVGRMIPAELRCTGLGGLSLTATSKRIDKEVNG